MKGKQFERGGPGRMKPAKNEANTGSAIRAIAVLALMISAMLATCFLLPSKAYAADLPASGEGCECVGG